MELFFFSCLQIAIQDNTAQNHINYRSYTNSEAAVPLQPMDVHCGENTHLLPMENPTPEHMDA